MTKITYSRSCEGMHIRAKGHAGYGDSGTDIVCSAISILLQSLVEYALESNTLEITKLLLSEGNADIDIIGESECFEMTLIGLEMLAETYPDNVEMVEISQEPR